MLGQRNLVILVAAFLVGCAGFAPASSSDTDRKLSDAIEQKLPSLVSAGDYWTASKVSFQLASAHARLKETRAACAALSQSLDYYRKDGEGMLEVRSLFGCYKPGSSNPVLEYAHLQS